MIYYVFHRKTGEKVQFQNKSELCDFLYYYFNYNNIKWYDSRVFANINKIKEKKYFKCNIRTIKEYCDTHRSVGIIIDGKEALG